MKFRTQVWRLSVALAPFMSLALVLEAGRRWVQ